MKHRVQSAAMACLVLFAWREESLSQKTREIALAQLAEAKIKLRSGRDVDQRREEVRRGFLKGARLWPPPVKTALNATIDRRREHQGYSVENVSLETLPGFYMTGNLYRPLGSKGDRPAVLVPHGHFIPQGRFHPDQQTLCAHLARMGAVVFSYGMVGWNDSKQTTHDDPYTLALQTWNSIRAVDFITHLPEVDSTRVGVTGASGGGTQSLYLALLDDRIRAVAPIVIVYPWTEADACNCEGGMPVLTPVKSNCIEVAALCAPKAQLVVSVEGDQTREYPEVGLPFMRHVYGLFDKADSLANVHLEGEGHDLGPSKRKAVCDFLAKELGLSPIDEDQHAITIETEESLAVIDAAHPLPKDAIKGRDAVSKLFQKMPRLIESELPDGRWTPAAESEGDFFLAPGIDSAMVAHDEQAMATLELTVRDREGGEPRPCRVVVVGSHGRYCLPPPNDLSEFALTGVWPAPGAWGNRPGKAPYRYLGRFFYSRGQSTLNVPPGQTRIIVATGIEEPPIVETVMAKAGETSTVSLVRRRAWPLNEIDYFSGDPHLHFPRTNDREEARILDLLAAEGIQYGAILAYNEPAGPYAGFMERMASPQMRGLGTRSEFVRDGVHIASGQEYRTAHFGHMNLYMRDDLVAPGREYNADDGPVYGIVAEETRQKGGYSIYAHGGYRQEVYADVALGNVDAVELLQFGVYRELGLADWYRILNCGYRLPITGASDYPACRWLGDCRTYVRYPGKGPSFADWMKGVVEGRGFVTTGPLLFLQVDGKHPGDVVARAGHGPHSVDLRLEAGTWFGNVSSIEIIVNGKVAEHWNAVLKPGERFEKRLSLAIEGPSWIAARAHGLSRGGLPDGEAHTNPIYVEVEGKRPFHRDDLDTWISRIDTQIAAHRARSFAGKAAALDYFQRARDRLLELRARGGHVLSREKHNASLQTNAADPAPTDDELATFLKPVPCKSPEEALRAFEMAPGFAVSLVAAEPLVVDPVAGAFDASGNLYVCEMRDYPFKPKDGEKPLGTVRLLRDTNADGVFDASTKFADSLLWVGGVACWDGGVYVAACPDVWYFKDTDGDGIADIKKKIFTGFGMDNQQAMVNNLAWGIDNKIYGVTAGNGGVVREVENPNAPPLSLNGRDFRFDPRTHKLEGITGTVQFGNAFDDWGNRFVCSESQPIQHIVLPAEYLSRNPFLAPPALIKNLAPGPVPIHRISPVERWRQIRSSRRIAANSRPADSAGASHHVIDAAAGLAIYRGGIFSSPEEPCVYVGDGQNNLIHRRRLKPDGVTFSTERIDKDTEFVRSSDTWFRPVNLLNAPDGSLFCLDMCREVLESIHIPLDVVKHLDLTSGRDRGRIWRIAPMDSEVARLANLSTLTSMELVQELTSPIGWRRDTAQRLLIERRAVDQTGALAALAIDGPTPQSRLHALWTLEGIDQLPETILLKSLTDVDAHVREHAIRIAEKRLSSQMLLDQVARLADDQDPRVRMQVAFSLGAAAGPQVAQALTKLLHRDGSDPWIVAAVLSSVGGSATDMLDGVVKDKQFSLSPAGQNVLEMLGKTIGGQWKDEALQQSLLSLASRQDQSGGDILQRDVLLAIADGIQFAGGEPLAVEVKAESAREMLHWHLQVASITAASGEASEADRVKAIRLLRFESFDRAMEVLEPLLDSATPEPIQRAAVQTLADSSEAEVGDILVSKWSALSAGTRKPALDALVSRPERAMTLMEAMKDGIFPISHIDPTHRELLLSHKNEKVRELAQSVLGRATTGRESIVAEYRDALQLPAETSRGKETFRRVCASCHRLREMGHAVGPTLSMNAVADGEQLLVHTLDPNRNVAPNYEQYIAIDTSGRSVVGVLTSQTPTSVTLTRENGTTEVLARSNIDELAGTGKSLMPEGLERSMTKQEIADVFAYLKSSLADSAAIETRDFGTLPGLVEPTRR